MNAFCLIGTRPWLSYRNLRHVVFLGLFDIRNDSDIFYSDPNVYIDNISSFVAKQARNSPVSSCRGLPWCWVEFLSATLGAPRVPHTVHCRRYDARSSPYLPSSSRYRAQWDTSWWRTAPCRRRTSLSDPYLPSRPEIGKCIISNTVNV